MREAREEEDEKKTDLMRRRNEIEFFNLFFFSAFAHKREFYR